MTSVATPRTKSASRAWLALDVALLVLGFWWQFHNMHHAIAGDAEDRFKTVRQWVEDGTFSSSRYSMVGPLFSVPLYMLGKWNETPEWWCARYNHVLMGAAVIALVVLLRRFLASETLRVFLLLLCFCSMFPKHLQGYYGEVFTALTMAVGSVLWSVYQRQRGWPWLVLGAANTPGVSVGVGLYALQSAWANKRLRALLWLGLVPLIMALESWLRRNGATATGYEEGLTPRTVLPSSNVGGFNYPFVLGLLSVLFSFGKGLLFFTPGLFLVHRPSTLTFEEPIKRLHAGWLALTVGLVVVYAKWCSWHGGWYWGPRFFLFVCFPASLALAHAWSVRSSASLLRNLVVLLVLVWSAWVGLNGAVYSQAEMSICQANNYAQEFLCWYTPDFSALLRPLSAPRTYSPKENTLAWHSAAVALRLAAPLVWVVVKQARGVLAQAWVDAPGRRG